MPSPKTNSTRCQVKICGIRDHQQAMALDALGVDWIGFNFHPTSSRYITPESAAIMIRGLRNSKPVGVFVDLDADEVIRIIKLTGIRYAQLHGREDWNYIRKMPIPVIKALPHNRLEDLGGLRSDLAKQPTEGHPLAYFLLDTATAPAIATASPNAPSGFGGSGQVFDWTLPALQTLPLPYFLAGGLGPENLAQALNTCSPFAVDLNSKVEVSPGNKDMEKVKACLKIVQERGA